MTPTGIGAYEFEPVQPGGCIGDVYVYPDGVVDLIDLMTLLEQWGSCADCPADIAPLSGDGVVDIPDLLTLLTGWGRC